jgi:DNA-binding transcriptional ArsR family regulator
MNNGTKQKIEDELYERQVGICKAFANPTRLRILDYVSHHPFDGSSLQRALGVSMANLSQHLAILKAAGVISMQRRGRRVYCSLSIPEVKQACELIRGVLRAQLRKERQLTITR